MTDPIKFPGPWVCRYCHEQNSSLLTRCDRCRITRTESDPVIERIEQLEQEIRAARRVRDARGIRVNPYITVQALGRLCERHHVEARVWWDDGKLQVRLVSRVELDENVPAFLKPQAE